MCQQWVSSKLKLMMDVTSRVSNVPVVRNWLHLSTFLWRLVRFKGAKYSQNITVWRNYLLACMSHFNPLEPVDRSAQELIWKLCQWRPLHRRTYYAPSHCEHHRAYGLVATLATQFGSLMGYMTEDLRKLCTFRLDNAGNFMTLCTFSAAVGLVAVAVGTVRI
jgi:hypothetical protein